MSKAKEREHENVPTEIIVLEQDESNNDSESSSTSNGKGRFKAVANKVIAARRLLLPRDQISSACQDPGIDPKSVDYDIYTRCKIFCLDFSERIALQPEELTNEKIENFLKKERPSGSKVRWINVDGISWDVIKPLSIHFDLHPLAIEDCLQGDERTKLDRYQNHLYVSLLLHSLVDSKTEERGDGYPKCHKDLLHHSYREDSRYLEAHRILRKQKLNITVGQVNIFLLENDVLITIFQHSGKSVYKPIISRINQPKTLLRTAQDASLLMEAIIDGIVDLAIPIKDSYRHQIAELEGRLLMRPKMGYTRELHMISGELTILKRTLGPIQGLVTSLREHGVEKNLISPLARTYFMDVSDHCIEITDDLDTMTKITENLVNMIFNLIAYETNENMRIIAIFSVIFLPMTFIAGYFGMNFTDFPELEYPLSYFWVVTGICTAAMFFLGTYTLWTRWICRLYKHLCRNKTSNGIRL